MIIYKILILNAFASLFILSWRRCLMREKEREREIERKRREEEKEVERKRRARGEKWKC